VLKHQAGEVRQVRGGRNRDPKVRASFLSPLSSPLSLAHLAANLKRMDQYGDGAYLEQSAYDDRYSNSAAYQSGFSSTNLGYDLDRELPGAYISDYFDDGSFDLDDYTNWIDREMPIFDAWGADQWDENQYALADLLVGYTLPTPRMLLIVTHSFASTVLSTTT
jgi:hypothetical protein